MSNTYQLDDRQHATVLAALRILQAQQDRDPSYNLENLLLVYMIEEGFEPMTTEELEELRMHLNVRKKADSTTNDQPQTPV